MDEKLKAGGTLTAEEEARYKKFDASLNKLKDRLTKGNLETGDRGHNQTAAMTEHMTKIWDKKANRKKDIAPITKGVSYIVVFCSPSVLENHCGNVLSNKKLTIANKICKFSMQTICNQI